MHVVEYVDQQTGQQVTRRVLLRGDRLLDAETLEVLAIRDLDVAWDQRDRLGLEQLRGAWPRRRWSRTVASATELL
jgi:hypothetical protein